MVCLYYCSFEMKKLIIYLSLIVSAIGNYAWAQDADLLTLVSTLEKRCEILQSRQDQMDSKVKSLIGREANQKRLLLQLQKENSQQQSTIDSLQTEITRLSATQSEDRTTFSGQIKKTNANVQVNESSLHQRTLWGGLIGLGIFFVLIAALYLLSKRIKKGSLSIDEVKKAQETLQSAQAKLEEESIKLDNKLLEVVEKQITVTPISSASNGTTPDHSLVLKVADEIVRIEMNLSRMDASVKGHKQLAKAVQRIKDNFQANGYEIVDMLGKPYNAGMKAAVTFVTDENLEAGQQIISKIIKPQINYQQQMIQAAQIEVSQPE